MIDPVPRRPETVTLVRGAVHNPADARHFMRVKALPHPAVAAVAGREIVRSDDAVRVQEVGRDLYDPVVYFPRASVPAGLLRATARTTRCPIKGETEYYDVVVGDRVLAEAAWSYVRTLDLHPDLERLRDRIAFDAAQVQVSELTAG